MLLHLYVFSVKPIDRVVAVVTNFSRWVLVLNEYKELRDVLFVENTERGGIKEAASPQSKTVLMISTPLQNISSKTNTRAQNGEDNSSYLY